MKIRTARSIRGPGVGGVALAGMAVLTATCASGANAPPVMGLVAFGCRRCRATPARCQRQLAFSLRRSAM